MSSEAVADTNEGLRPVDADNSSQSPGEESGADETDQAADQLGHALATLASLKQAVSRQVLGRDAIIDLVIIALIADGHVLLEDHPGSGKTTLAKALGECISKPSAAQKNSSAAEIVPFRRIQFTPDLLPSDVTGVPVFDSSSNSFSFRPGPVFAHVLLADEINRTSPKVQSAMLEAMGEKQVTVDNQTYPLDELFFVIATQNPLDLAGTYPLPTPQLDRFLFKITMEHIDRDAELEVLETYLERKTAATDAFQLSQDDVLAARRQIEQNVAISSQVKTALVDISRNLRNDERVLQGNSTRSMVLLLPALQVAAALAGRRYVNSDDIELLLPRVLAHRVELAPGVSSFDRVLRDCVAEPMEQLARSTLA